MPCDQSMTDTSTYHTPHKTDFSWKRATNPERSNGVDFGSSHRRIFGRYFNSPESLVIKVARMILGLPVRPAEDASTFAGKPRETHLFVTRTAP